MIHVQEVSSVVGYKIHWMGFHLLLAYKHCFVSSTQKYATSSCYTLGSMSSHTWRLL